MVKILNTNEFEEVLKKEGLIVADFFAVWCGPCKMMSPVFDAVASEFSDKADFYKVDIDEGAELAEKYNVMSVPSLLFFLDGKLVKTNVGFLSADEMKEMIETLVQENAVKH